MRIIVVCIICILGVIIWKVISNLMIKIKKKYKDHTSKKIHKDYTVINKAIFLYRMDCIDNDDNPLVEYDDMTPVKTILSAISKDRRTYKGYKSILDPKKLSIIESYIPIALSYINENKF